MPLLPITHDFIALVERETGYPVRLVEEPQSTTLARVQMARGVTPAHFVFYRPVRDDSLDYLICYQLGFVLRLFEAPPSQRFSFGFAQDKVDDVVELLVGPGSKLAQFGLSPAKVRQLAEMYLSGLLTHLRSIPIGMRVADWIASNYPALAASQRAAVLKELAEAKTALQPQIRETTPDVIYKPSVAISAAHAAFWGDRYGMRELEAPYRSYGYHREGRALLQIWQDVPADPAHDRDLVDRWADNLQLAGWYRWLPYQAPE